MPAEREQRVRHGRGAWSGRDRCGEKPAADAVLRGTPSTGAGKEWGVFPLAAKFGIERDLALMKSRSRCVFGPIALAFSIAASPSGRLPISTRRLSKWMKNSKCHA